VYSKGKKENHKRFQVMRKIRLILVSLLLAGITQACNLPIQNPTTPSALPTNPPIATSSPVEYLHLVDVEDGDTVSASIDPESGFPMTQFQVEIDYPLHEYPRLTLDADGVQVFISETRDASPEEPITISWTPWHGNGVYQLVIRLLERNSDVIFPLSFTLNISGIPEETPTIQERFIQLYQEHYNLNLSAPPFAHFGVTYKPAEEEENRWISVAYIQDKIYVINLFDSGAITHRSRDLYNSNTKVGACHPLGKYKILTIIVDYGNPNLNKEEVERDLERSAEKANQHWADYSASINLSDPILEIENTIVYVDTPPDSEAFLTPAEVETLTGYDPTQFDLLAEVDIDIQNRAIQKHTGGGGGGLAFPGICQTGDLPYANISVNIRRQTASKYAGASLFEHELMHMLGWNHWWPIGDGSSTPEYSDGFILPYLLFGWTDTDGDGIIEINDPTPYGLLP
jgi:hypothetical protein